MRRFSAPVLFAALLSVFILASTVEIHSTFAGSGNQPRPATHVELERYLGTWFDIMSIPNSFQRGCTDTTATYLLESSGSIAVTNGCRVIDDGGTFEKDTSIVGRGWIKNEARSMLKVSFSCFLGYCAEKFAGDYWILELGPINQEGLYSWAIVGGPTREFGWVLSRTPALDAEAMMDIESRLLAQGYDPESFRTTLHGQ